MKVSKQAESWMKYLMLIGVFAGFIITTFEGVVDKVTFKSRQRDTDIELLLHSANHSIEVDIALMDKVEGAYYITDEGGALTNVMLFQTADDPPEVFALVPDTRMLYTLHILEWDDSREEWEYIIDNEPMVIYER